MYRQVILGSLATGLALGLIAPVTGASIQPLHAIGQQARQQASSISAATSLPEPVVEGVAVTGMPEAVPISYSTALVADSSFGSTGSVQVSANTPEVNRSLPIVKVQPAAAERASGTAAAITYTDMTMSLTAAQPAHTAEPATRVAHVNVDTASAQAAATPVASLD